MSTPAGPGLVLAAGLVAFVSALGGALLALAIDEPEVVFSEIVVEVPATTPIAELFPPDLEHLTERYVELAGEESEWTSALVHELGGSVCQLDYSASELYEEFQADITMEFDVFDGFIDEVRDVCPEPND